MVFDPLNFNWDDIAKELREKLKREPETLEIQAELLRKYWHSTNILEKQE